MPQYKSRKLDRNYKSYEEQIRLLSVFDKVEREMGMTPSSYQIRRIERMVTDDMNASVTNSEKRICRGEIYYVVPEGEVAATDKNSPFIGGRPAVIISNDMNNEMQGLVEVAYCTTHPRNNLPTNVVIMSTGTKSTVICDQIYTVSKKRIGKYVGECTINEIKKIDEALALSLSLNFKTKNVAVNILESWKTELANSYTTTQLNQIEEADDALYQAKSVGLSDSTENLNVGNSNEPDPVMFVIDALKSYFGENSDLLLSSKEEFDKWLSRCTENTAKVDTLSRELYEKQKEIEMSKLMPQAAPKVDITTVPEYIKVCAERDVFRELYIQSLQNKL